VQYQGWDCLGRDSSGGSNGSPGEGDVVVLEIYVCGENEVGKSSLQKTKVSALPLLGAWRGTGVCSEEKYQLLWLVKRRSEKLLYQVYKGM
jgi:hypothetical protein